MPLGSFAMCPRFREGVKWHSRVMPRRSTLLRIGIVILVMSDTGSDLAAAAM